MKYCLKYKKYSTKVEEVDEVLISYRDNVLIDVIEYMQKHPKQRFILDMVEFGSKLNLTEIKKLNKIKEENPNFDMILRFPEVSPEIIEQLSEVKIKFFFNILISNWDNLNGILDLGVSDVYIVEELGFQLDKVAEVVHEKRAQVRVFPNVCQTSWKGTDPLKTFFIRPEDVDIYEDYVDVFEFFGDKRESERLLDIYKEKQRWFGPLNEIIIGMDDTLNSKYILPRFPERRINCGKDCMKGGKCQLCDRIKDIAETLKEGGIAIPKRKKEDING